MLIPAHQSLYVLVMMMISLLQEDMHNICQVAKFPSDFWEILYAELIDNAQKYIKVVVKASLIGFMVGRNFHL